MPGLRSARQGLSRTARSATACLGLEADLAQSAGAQGPPSTAMRNRRATATGGVTSGVQAERYPRGAPAGVSSQSTRRLSIGGRGLDGFSRQAGGTPCFACRPGQLEAQSDASAVDAARLVRAVPPR